MKRQNVFIPDPVYDDLKKMAEARDIKVTEAIRRAIEDAVEKWKKSGGGK